MALNFLFKFYLHYTQGVDGFKADICEALSIFQGEMYYIIHNLLVNTITHYGICTIMNERITAYLLLHTEEAAYLLLHTEEAAYLQLHTEEAFIWQSIRYIT